MEPLWSLNLCMNGPTTSLFRAGFPLLGEIAFVGGGGFVCLFFIFVVSLHLSVLTASLMCPDICS